MATVIAEEKQITMDFQEVELKQVIRFIAEMTGRNFVVDEQVKGRATIVTPSPVSLGEAEKIFQTMLLVQGYTIIEREGIMKIVPLNVGIGDGGKEDFANRNPGNENLVSRLIRIEQVEATSLAASLKPLVHAWGALVAHGPSNAIIVSDTHATVDRIVELIGAMDVAPNLAQRQIFKIQNGTVSYIEKLLTGIYAEYNSSVPKGVVGIKFFSDPRSNILICTAPQERMLEVDRLIRNLDVNHSDTSLSNLHLYYPKNGKAELIAKVLNELLNASKSGSSGNSMERVPLEFNRTIHIVGEKETNTLVIAADPDDYQKLLPIIHGLDIRRLQVHVEALIVEVTADRAADFGIEWRFANAPQEGSGTLREYGGSSFGAIQSIMANPLQPPDGMTLGLMKGGISVGGHVVPNLGALVQAMQSDTEVNILATPNIITMDNEEAEIIVGENIPLRTGTMTGVSSSTSFERKDVGITLKIRPAIMEDGWLRMEIYQEQSGLSDRTLTIGTNETEIITRKRAIKTQAILRNKEVVVLGGLISEDVSEKVKQVPCLGGFYGVGEMFKQTSRSKNKSNLMVFIRPVIINTNEDILLETRKKINTMQKSQPESATQGSQWIDPVDKPSIKEFLRQQWEVESPASVIP
ncbi:MAG: type II secretion system secretin GspD [Nitrospirae bacterium]|nr:type II secretion system secretin GspD [Magnetococcales bacterium]